MNLEQSTHLSNNLPDAEFLQEWLVHKLIPLNQTTMLYAQEDHYKSFLGLDISMMIANGVDTLGKSKLTGVLYLCLENVAGFKERVQAIHNTNPSYTPIHINSLPFDICEPAEVTKYVTFCLKTGIGFLVIDTLSHALLFGDESNPITARNVRNAFTTFNANSITVLVIHHTGKNDSAGARGSAILTYDLSSRLRVKKGKGLEGKLVIEKSKSDSAGKTIPFNMVVHKNTLLVEWNKDATTPLGKEILESIDHNLMKVSDLRDLLHPRYPDIEKDSFRKKVQRELDKLSGQQILELVRENKVIYVRRTHG